MILLANTEQGVRRQAPRSFAHQASRPREKAPAVRLAQHPERSEWARAFRRGADLAEAALPCEVPEGGACRRVGFGEMFNRDNGGHER